MFSLLCIGKPKQRFLTNGNWSINPILLASFTRVFVRNYVLLLIFWLFLSYLTDLRHGSLLDEQSVAFDVWSNLNNNNTTITVLLSESISNNLYNESVRPHDSVTEHGDRVWPVPSRLDAIHHRLQTCTSVFLLVLVSSLPSSASQPSDISRLRGGGKSNKGVRSTTPDHGRKTIGILVDKNRVIFCSY